MKRVYFDTNIYNELIKTGNTNAIKAIKNAVTNKKIVVFISFNNIYELFHAYKNDSSQAERLFKLAWSICLHKPTQHAQVLINAEFRHLIDPSVRINIYSNDCAYKNSFMSLWGECTNSASITKEQIERRCGKIKNTTGKFSNAMKNLRRVSNGVQENNKPPNSLKEFLDWAINKSSYVNDFIEAYLNKINNPKLTIDLVKKNILSMGGFCHHFYHHLGLAFKYTRSNEPIKPSDYGDLGHAVYAGYSDIFVCNDPSFRKYLRVIIGSKHSYLDLKEFLDVCQVLK